MRHRELSGRTGQRVGGGGSVRDRARRNWGAGTGGESERKSRTGRSGREADGARGELARAPKSRQSRAWKKSSAQGEKIRPREERIRPGGGGRELDQR
jgi:hypothetical protein